MRRVDRGTVLGMYRATPTRQLIEDAKDLGVSGLDTAYNYSAFSSHRILGQSIPDLLGSFRVSTKVGFFPDDQRRGSVHSLDPDRLALAISRSGEELGKTPDVVLLHNPERTLQNLTPREGLLRLRDACSVLADMASTGQWGISTWNPGYVVRTLRYGVLGHVPQVVMVRAGLSVPHSVLKDGEELCGILSIPYTGRWGMSPFGGDASHAAWRTANLRAFLADRAPYTSLQIAFRVAFEVPKISNLAVGTQNPTHLRDLIKAVAVPVNDRTVGRYRELIERDSVYQ